MTGDPTPLRLDSDWIPTGGAPGVLTLTLHNLGDRPIGDFRLALTSLFRIPPEAKVEGGRLLSQISNYHVIAPPEGFVLDPGAAWSVSANRLSHTLRHYTDGPKSAYVVLSDETLLPVSVTHTTRSGQPGTPRLVAAARSDRAVSMPSVGVLPFPHSVDVSGQRDASLPLQLVESPPEARAAFAAAASLAGRLFPDEPPLFSETGGIVCKARLDPASEADYRIAFALGAITITAAARDSFLHAFVTLGQMLRSARAAPSEARMPASGEIVDHPRFGWRGVMLDVARQVYRIPQVTRLADQAAWLKLNRLHLHLTDDEGWRLDIPGYPQVARTAAWRGHGLPVPPLLGSPPERHGGVFSRSELAALVSHAGELGVTVVPEIDIPGHCHCVLEAIPALRDPGEIGTYRSIQSFPNNALNPALPETYAFLEAVFAEVATIFPSPWIHVGGDEVADDAWLGSPAAQALMREHGWREVGQLQSHFLRRAQEMLRGLGREVGAWQEAALGSGIDASGSYLVAWRDAAAGLALARQGYDVVMAPAQHYYLDMAQSDDWWEPGGSWAGTVSPEASYAYDPGADWPNEVKSRLMGVQACLWSENLHDRRLVDHMLLPRLAALAETAWTVAGRKDLDRFHAVHPLILPASGASG